MLLHQLQAPRMAPAIRVQKTPLGIHAEMADLKYEIDVVGWDGRSVGRICYLRDKAAVLAQGCRQTLARAGWPRFKHIGENLLVFNDRGFR